MSDLSRVQSLVPPTPATDDRLASTFAMLFGDDVTSSRVGSTLIVPTGPARPPPATMPSGPPTKMILAMPPKAATATAMAAPKAAEAIATTAAPTTTTQPSRPSAGEADAATKPPSIAELSNAPPATTAPASKLSVSSATPTVTAPVEVATTVAALTEVLLPTAEPYSPPRKPLATAAPVTPQGSVPEITTGTPLSDGRGASGRSSRSELRALHHRSPKVAKASSNAILDTRGADVVVGTKYSGSRTGLISSFVYMLFATCLIVSTYGLNSMANTKIDLGKVEEAWTHDVWDCPIMTFLQGKASLTEFINTTYNATSGSLSLSDLQYDKCGLKDWPCAEKLRPNTERIFLLLASTFSVISNFELPEYAGSLENVQMQYVNQLAGWNFPVVQYFIPGNEWAVVCSVRRSSYHMATESIAEIDSAAMCSKRQYDPDWICENEVANDVTTYVIKIQKGKATYVGQTTRGELYYNPGNIATLTGSMRGKGLFTAVPSTDEYNGGIVLSAAPWDVCPAYLCKGTFDFDTYVGMRWQGQGKVAMTWEPSSLLFLNSIALWSMTMYFALIQLTYLPRSSVCVIPVFMSKSPVGLGVLGLACYGNYNVQVLTTFLSLNKVTTFNVEPFRICGPLVMASVIGIMSGTVMQIFYNPYLAVPSYVLTVVSVINFVLVFVLEAYVFPHQSVMIARPCALTTSTACSNYSAVQHNYFLSPIIGGVVIVAGIGFMALLDRRTKIHTIPPKNSVLRLFGAKSMRSLATSNVLGCIHVTPNGDFLVDAGVLLNKNFVRVSNEYAIRNSNLKYAIVYRMLPDFLGRVCSAMVGQTLALRIDGDKVTKQFVFKELKDLKLNETAMVSSFFT